MLRPRFSKSLALAILAPALSTPLAIAEDVAFQTASAQLVSTAVQDEPLKKPKDMTAMISRADRRVRFELVRLSGVAGQSLAGTPVTLIDSMGQAQNTVVDASGTAVVDNVEPGAHAVVIGSEGGHLALPLIVRSDESEQPAAPSTVKLPLVSVDPEEAMASARAALPEVGTANFDDIDFEYVSTGSISDAYNFRYRLGSAGELSGQVMTLVRKGVMSSEVAGTQISIYRDGVVAGQATADAQGQFQIAGLGEGAFGMIAVGPGGYAAFGFETYTEQSVAHSLQSSKETLVSTMTQAAAGDVLPVMLIPPALVEPMLVSLEQSYAGLLGGAGMGPMAGMAPAAAFGGIAAGMNGFAGAAGGAGGGAAGAAGGLGGLGALAAVAAIAPAIAIGNNNNNDFPGINASPVQGP